MERRLAGYLVAIAALLLAAPATAAVGPGCDQSRPAIAHFPGGDLVRPQPPNRPIPCGMQTGFAGGESAIAVTNSGAVFYAPAVQSFAGVQAQYFLGGNSGFARTLDGGAKWTFVDPVALNAAFLPGIQGPPPNRFSNSLGYPAWDQIDDKFFVDRHTGRLFWTDPDLPSEAVVWTDDDGLSWGLSELPVGFGGEWTQVTTASPRSSKPSGYPEVVYACGEYDSLARDASTRFEGDLCQKSLDGGQTWVVAGQALFGSPLATHPQCNGQSEHPNFSPWAAPDQQGRLYELLFCGGKTYLIRSDDEAASWKIAARVPYALPNVGPGGTGSAELRSDSLGNLYLAWTVPGNPNPNNGYSPNRLYLVTSRDEGRHWSNPIDVLAPGVAGIRTHFGFDVGAPGHVAISYLGQRGHATAFDGYITETQDALAPRPLLYSGVVNQPSQPPLDSGGKGSSNGMGLDYVSVAIGPDGTPWASFWDTCGGSLPARTTACPPSRTPPDTTTIGYRDFAGRLVGVPSAPRCPTASGRLAGSSLGPVSLGASRSQVRSLSLLVTTHGRARMDYVCFWPVGIRVGYSSHRRVVLALTSNPFYSLHGVRPGMTLRAAARSLRLGRGFRIGANTWYLVSNDRSRGVLKVRFGTVEEVGIANRMQTAHRRTPRSFLSSFS